ncbi:MAG: hypothetical protein JXX14_11205 [Deltaproteobacteria bacterium]|nr:hypothetical protein [Deltaproteobacteria bacterium]
MVAFLMCVACGTESADESQLTDDVTTETETASEMQTPPFDFATEAETSPNGSADSASEAADDDSEVIDWQALTDLQISQLLEADTAQCEGKNMGDSCTTTVFGSPICSAWGSLYQTEGVCNADDNHPLYCDVEYKRCASDDSAMSCASDAQNGDMVMIARSACEYAQGGVAQCIRREPAVAQICNDRIGNRLCHDVSETESTDNVYEITGMKCAMGKFVPECVPESAELIENCAETGQYCEFEKEEAWLERLPENVEIESSYNHSWFARDYIAATDASCEAAPPCHNKSIGDACETGMAATCDNSMLVQSTGVCDISEMTMHCMPSRVSCESLECVESNGSASCQ